MHTECAVPAGTNFPKGKLKVFLPYFLYFTKSRKRTARTCKKLPVASFCASETAETGRIANGREQGDHVSGRQGRKKDLIGFVQKCIFVCADSRFAKPRKVPKGFNFVRVKLLFGWADSRFAKPRCSLQRERFYSFCVVQKEPKSTPEGCDPLDSRGTIQSSVGEDFSRVFRRHEPKPVFRTKRRRKGFESVRGSGVTA